MLFGWTETVHDGFDGQGEQSHVVQPTDERDDVRYAVQGGDGVEDDCREDDDVARGDEFSLAPGGFQQEHGRIQSRCDTALAADFREP